MPITEPDYTDVTVLPKYEDDEITKATGTYPDSRSLIERSNRSTYLLNRLLEIARGRQTRGDLSKALEAFEAAKKVDHDYNNGNFFRDNMEIGFLLGDMNRWIEAKRVFDRAVKSRWKATEAAKIAEFCIKHKKNHIAMSFAKVLEKGVEDPVVTLTYSKVLYAAKEPERAVPAAERAYYLATAIGTDATEAKQWLNSITSASIPEPQPNKTYERDFWEKFDKLLKSDSCPVDVRGLAEPPTFINGAVGLNGETVTVGLKSDALKGSVRYAVLHKTSDYTITGITLQPNILTCCLNKQDVLNHLKSISSGNGWAPPTEPLDALLVTDEHEQIQVEMNKKNVTFGFRTKGFGLLTAAMITWKTKGPKLFKDKPSPRKSVVRDWKSYFETAQKQLRSRHFKDCKRSLCRAFVHWSGNWREGAINFDNKRLEYEALKKAFISLYEAWEHPEIAEYFKIVPYPQLEKDVLEVDGEMVVDFPTAAEQRHNQWKVTFVDPDCYDIQIKGSGTRSAYRGTPLFDAIQLACGSAEAPVEKEIYPPPAKLIDDEIFNEKGRF